MGRLRNKNGKRTLTKTYLNLKAMKTDAEELKTLLGFISDNSKNKPLSKGLSNEIEKLFNLYKKPVAHSGDTIITVDVGGIFGNIQIREALTAEQTKLSYKSGNYDYVSIKVKTEKTVLWTDYENTEPYNRNSEMYIGVSFKNLKLIKETEAYREFECKSDSNYGISFPVWGYSYNNFWGTIRFGICLNTSDAEEFVTKLRTLLNK